jgi:hypothetical protein
MTDVRDTEPRLTRSISTGVGRSEAPRPPVLPVPDRPAFAFPLLAGSPPAGLVHEMARELATRINAKTLYRLSLRDKRPPRGLILPVPFY